MDQVEQGLASTITFTFSTDGVATDPSPATATVTVKRADGTVLHSNAATTHVGTGEFSYKLLPADTAQLDTLDLAWTATLDSVAQTFHTKVEIVGGFYFTIEEFLARYAGDDGVQGLSAAVIADARRTAEEIIERACNVAFVPRVKRLTLSGDGRTRLSIPLYKLRAVQSFSIKGAAGNTSILSLEGSSVFRSCWPRGFSNVLVTVEHGFDEPPAEIKDAAVLLTYSRAVKGPITDRATAMTPPDGGTITLATPGLRGSVTGIPAVDQAIAQYGLPPIEPVSMSLADRGNAFPPLPVL